MENLREKERKERKKKRSYQKGWSFQEKVVQRDIGKQRGEQEDQKRMKKMEEMKDGKEHCRRQRENGDKPTINGR